MFLACSSCECEFKLDAEFNTELDIELGIAITIAIVAENLDLTKRIGCNPSMTKATATLPPPKRVRTFLWIAGLSTFATIPVHLYLVSRHYALQFGQVDSKSLCNINATFNCEAVAASRFAEFLGVPMALWGALANSALLVLFLLFPLTEESRRPVARRNLLIFSGFIAAMSVIMGGISAIALSAYCLFCLLTYVLSFVTFGSLWKGLPSEPKKATATEAAAAVAALAPRASAQSFLPLVIAGIAIFLGGIIINDQAKRSYGFQDMSAFVQGQLQEWQANPEVRIQPVEPLVIGASPERAKMTIVEFADFRCIHCKHAAPVLKAFVAAHQDVRLEFQTWPLDGECNTSIPNANGASCLLARAVHCAQKLGGKGWDAHNHAFDNQANYGSVDAVKADLPRFAEVAGVPTPEFEVCSQSEETKKTVERQAAVGSALNLRGTPTIYVNGRQLPAAQSLPVLNEVHKRLTSN